MEVCFVCILAALISQVMVARDSAWLSGIYGLTFIWEDPEIPVFRQIDWEAYAYKTMPIAVCISCLCATGRSAAFSR